MEKEDVLEPSEDQVLTAFIPKVLNILDGILEINNFIL